MKLAVLMIAMAGLGLLANAASAQSPKATTVPAVNAAPSKVAASDKMVCKSIASTGTRFVKHDCRTQTEWDQIAADSRAATQDMISRQGGSSGH